MSAFRHRKQPPVRFRATACPERNRRVFWAEKADILLELYKLNGNEKDILFCIAAAAFRFRAVIMRR